MNNRPNVWVLKEQVRSGPNGVQPFDYTPAYKYGDLRFMTDFDLPMHGGSSLAKEWHKNVDSCIGDMDEDRDFLILTGQPLAIYMVGQKLRNAQLFPRLLVWRREQDGYVVYDAPNPFHRLIGAPA